MTKPRKPAKRVERDSGSIVLVRRGVEARITIAVRATRGKAADDFYAKPENIVHEFQRKVLAALGA